MDDLRAANADVVVDDVALAAEGRLVLDVHWPLPEGKMHLRAIYPDEFPYTRPEVIDVAQRIERHSSPLGHNLCLLPRGTHNWSSSWTLRKLLNEQLEKCLAAAAQPLGSDAASNEERVGEPVEYWWNMRAIPRSYCLIDSAWEIDPSVSEGTLKLRYLIEETNREVPRVRAFIQEVRRIDGTVLAAWTAAEPQFFKDARTMVIPWARLARAPMPTGAPEDLAIFTTANPWFASPRYKPARFDNHISAAFRAILYRTELGWRKEGDGWSFGFLFGRKPEAPTIACISTFRAGETDIGLRVPAVASLRDATVVVVGAGGIGAPTILDLARNGCGVIRIVEHDLAEPGIAIRWPIGATAWGDLKADALQALIHRDYPRTRVEVEHHAVGKCSFIAGEASTDAVLEKVMNGAQLVIDATAEIGVNLILNNRCRSLGMPLITAHATPTMEGGVVARFLYGYGGCRMCLEHSWADRTIPQPRGEDARDTLTQPMGCAERTFHGASFDLTEIALQVVRMAVDTLSDAPRYSTTSVVQVVSFSGVGGEPHPPQWSSDQLATHPLCECAKAR